MSEIIQAVQPFGIVLFALQNKYKKKYLGIHIKTFNYNLLLNILISSVQFSNFSALTSQCITIKNTPAARIDPNKYL